ncbi:protein sister of odd and bowel-like isoform X14 [Pecten maximus]|uniref:protein sister of odd and bowel-like isoform X14 n=1 Tax=Pecten maximus TaxID=6579 RepID=UPI0014582B44|nr:protein sister of odd and bowel-like isoform X14 [Pecten maximus]XP_033753462.1 protein sister of odd and bowel-like isoform X14 [Pecten maximus]
MNYQKVYMNQIHSSSLLCQLSEMWKNQLLCDAIIKTGQIITKAHRVVLVAACPMLQSMENAAAGSHLEVRLAADIKQESVNTFLQYLYEGFMMLTEENVRDVEKVARLLQVDSVIKCVADFYKCMHAKTGIAFPGTQYKYNFNDLIEFRHVRVTDLQKTVHDGAGKRMSDFPRPGSPGSKRPRLHRGGSPSDVTVIGSDKADDTASMSHSYMAGAPDPWDRVPKLGSGMGRQGASGRNSQPGVIEIVEESIELVQTEPPEKDSGQSSSSRSSQKTSSSISIAIASQYNTDPDLSIVNVPEKPSSVTQPPGPSSSSSTPQHGSITVSPLTVFQDSQHAQSSPSSSSSSRDMPGLASSSSTDRLNERQTSFRQEQPFSGFSQKPEENMFSPSKFHQQQPRTSETHTTSTPQRTPFPVSMAPSASLGKPFAAGSAMQAMVTSSPIAVSQSSPAPSKPRPTPPPPQPMGIPDSSSLPMDVGLGGDDGKGKSTKIELADSMQESTSDLTPDLSIVKVEAALGEGETGGLDMHVDMAEQSIMQMQAGTSHQEEFEEPSDAEIEEWAREEMSNEGANMSGDPNSSWYMGSYKGKPSFGDETFDCSTDLSDRMSSFSFPCEICQVVYSSAEDLKTHLRSHGVSPVVNSCEICHVAFSSGENLKTHMNQSHGEEFKYMCFDCGRGFTSYSSFNNHQRLFHRADLKCPVCNICWKIFPFESNLRYHYKKHSEVREYVCQHCGKSYKHKGKLKMHNCLVSGQPQM